MATALVQENQTPAPMLFLSLAAAIGIVAALFFECSGQLIMAAVLAALTATLTIAFSSLRRFAFGSLLITVVLLFFGLTQSQIDRPTRLRVRAALGQNDSCTVVGRMTALNSDNYGSVAVLRDALLVNEVDSVACNHLLVRVRLDSAQTILAQPEDMVVVSGNARPDSYEMRGSVRNLFIGLTERTGLTLFADSLGLSLLQERRASAASLLFRVRAYISLKTESLFGADAAALCRALWLGDQSEFGSNFRDELRLTGLTHIFALSGMNVAVVATLFWFLTGALLLRRRPRLLVVLLVLIAYCGIGGAAPSLVRATLMAAIYVVGQFLTRRVQFVNLVFGAMFLELLYAPLDILTPSFLLSYGSLLSIGLTYSTLRQMLRSLLRRVSTLTFARAIIELLTVTLAAQLAMIPLQALLFDRIPFFGLLANIVAIPGFTAIQILSLAAAVLSLIWAPLAMLPVMLVEEITYGLSGMVTTVADIPLAGLSLSVGLIGLLLLSAAAVLGILALRRSSLSLCFSALLCIGNVAVDWDEFVAHEPQRLVAIDVENGDAILLQHGARAVLIDAGPRWDTWSAVTRIKPVLREAEIEQLDALILTHPDNDHIGGALELIETESVDHLYVNGDSSASVSFATLRELLARRRIPVDTLQAGDNLSLADNFQLHVLSPDPELLHTRERANQAGLVIRANWDSASVLLTADIDSIVEQELLPLDTLLDIDLLKIGHHGSKSSSCGGFLDACTPQLAVISAGRHNLYGHPSPQVLARLAERQIPAYITHSSGSIWLEAFDGSWKRVPSRAERWGRRMQLL